MEINKYNVGQRIKSIRQSHNLTMNDFGKIIDAPKSAVNNWEKGRNLPNEERINKIAKLGNTTTNFIIYGSLRDFTFNLLSEYIWQEDDMYEDIKQTIWEYTTRIQTDVNEMLMSVDFGLVSNINDTPATNEEAKEAYRNIKMNAIYKTIRLSMNDLMKLVNDKNSYELPKILEIANNFFKLRLKYVDNTFKGKISLLNDASTKILDNSDLMFSSSETFNDAIIDMSKYGFTSDWSFKDKLESYFSAKLLDLVIDFHNNIAMLDNEYNQELKKHNIDDK